MRKHQTILVTSEIRKFLLFGVFVASVSLVPGTASAKTCTGKWGGKTATSISFKKPGTLQYCFKGKCRNVRYKGNPNGRISFRARGAWIKLIPTGSGYRGSWRNQANRTASATYRCSS